MLCSPTNAEKEEEKTQAVIKVALMFCEEDRICFDLKWGHMNANHSCATDREAWREPDQEPSDRLGNFPEFCQMFSSIAVPDPTGQLRSEAIM